MVCVRLICPDEAKPAASVLQGRTPGRVPGRLGALSARGSWQDPGAWIRSLGARLIHGINAPHGLSEISHILPEAEARASGVFK